MKKINYRWLITLIAILFIATTACARKKSYPKAPAYHGSVNNEFPIVASYAFYKPFMTDIQFAWVREAGFNILRKSLGYDEIDLCLKLAAKHDIYVMVAPWDIKESSKTAGIVTRYKNRPNVWGYAVADEPNASQFGSLRPVMSQIAKLDPEKNGYINLLPEMGARSLLAKNYETYLDEYITEVNPPFLSFDSYPIRMDKNRQYYIAENYFNTIEKVAAAAKDSSRPFWSYVLSNQHAFYPAPKEEHIRFQVFMALAYGAQGLNYFTYLMPDYDKGKNEFSAAPIDWNGNRTATWYMVKNVNNEVHALKDVFLGAEVEMIGHTGRVDNGATKLKKLPATLNKLESKGEGLIVSELKNGNRRYILIVNKELNKSVPVVMTSKKVLTQIFGNGERKQYNSEGFTLTPGGYALFEE